MALNTGKKITRRNWDAIPMPDLVIARVNVLGIDQPELLTFTDRQGRLIGDVGVPGNLDDLEQEDDDVEIPGVDPILDNHIEIPGVDDGVGPEDPAPQAIQEIAIDDLEVQEPDPAPIEVETVPDETVEQVAPAIETAEQLPEPRRSTRAKTKIPRYVPSMSGSRYGYAVTQLEDHGVLHPDAHMFMQSDFYQAEPDVVAMVMTQLSLKAGLKAWGDDAYAAAHSEMKQLHWRNTFKPKHLRELSHSQRQMVLESHMFLKEKRDGKMKARTVAGGNKQQGYISKEDAS